MSEKSAEPSRSLAEKSASAAVESLPPVEAPSAGFIVKLFVIPFVIVSIIVGVWAAIYWLANMNDDPMAYVDELKRNNESRWQAAHNLASFFQRAGNEKYRKDAKLLEAVVQRLEAENAAGGTEDSSVQVRMYLCMTVGEFHLPAALPPLTATLEKNRSRGVKEVRLAALLGVARLVPNIRDELPPEYAELRKLVFEAADDAEPVVRSHAAHVLFTFGDDESKRRLESLVRDGNVDVRMNAAIKLARFGNPACLGEVARMLDPAMSDELLATENPEDEAQRESLRAAKRLKIYEEGMEAALQYHNQAPAADVTPLVEALDKLLASNPDKKLRLAAEGIRRDLLAPPRAK